MKKRIQAVLALVIIAMPVVVLAEQKEDDSSNEIVLEEVVVTATRSVENIKEIPAKVEVVDSQTIEHSVIDWLFQLDRQSIEHSIVDWLFQLKDEYDSDEHRFIAGIDYQDIGKESRSYNKHSIRKAPYSPNEGRTNIAGYLETIWKLIDKRIIVTDDVLRYHMFDVDVIQAAIKASCRCKVRFISTG